MQLIYRDNFCHLAHSSNFGRKRITPLGETVIIYFTSWRGCDLYQLKILHRFDINMNIPRTIGHVNIYIYTYTMCITHHDIINGSLLLFDSTLFVKFTWLCAVVLENRWQLARSQSTGCDTSPWPGSEMGEQFFFGWIGLMGWRRGLRGSSLSSLCPI